MKEERLTCDRCKEIIEVYSPYPSYSHYEVRPIPYLHYGFVYSLVRESEPIRHYCSKCWKVMKSNG